MTLLPIPAHEHYSCSRTVLPGWPPAQLQRLSRVDINQPAGWPAHLHAGTELLLVEHGTWCGSIGGRKMRVDAGDAAIIFHGDTHVDRLLEPVTYTGILCTWEIGLVPVTSATPRVLPGFAATHLGVVDRLRLCLPSISANPAVQRQSELLAACILTGVLAALKINPPVQLEGDLYRRLEKLVRHNPHAVTSVSDMVRLFGTSERSLRRASARDYALSPLALLRQVRLDLADEYLRQGSGSVTEVAHRLGFASAAHFSRIFLQRFGMAPSLYAH